MPEYQAGQVVLVKKSNSKKTVIPVFLVYRRSIATWVCQKKMTDGRLSGTWTKSSLLPEEKIIRLADDQNDNPFGVKDRVGEFFYNSRNKLFAWAQSQDDKRLVDLCFLRDNFRISVPALAESDLFKLANLISGQRVCIYDFNDASTLNPGLAVVELFHTTNSTTMKFGGGVTVSIELYKKEMADLQAFFGACRRALMKVTDTHK